MTLFLTLFHCLSNFSFSPPFFHFFYFFFIKNLLLPILARFCNSEIISLLILLLQCLLPPWFIPILINHKVHGILHPIGPCKLISDLETPLEVVEIVKSKIILFGPETIRSSCIPSFILKLEFWQNGLG